MQASQPARLQCLQIFDRSENGNAPLLEQFGDAIGFAARGDVWDEGGIGKGDDDFVAAYGGFAGHSLWLVLEGREEEDTSGIKSGSALFGYAHVLDGASGTDDDWLLATKQDLQALLLDRGVKSADYCLAIIT